MISKQNKAKVKKVVRGLNKASKLHAGQAKTLKSMLKGKKSKGK
jgi:DNA anti-recombination protein RmuC|tara:strand:+ start:408 stop:539 length:132 start_codon:yes stop_codon:yes gene_type:complete